MTLGSLVRNNTTYIGDDENPAMSGLTDIDFGSGIKISSIHAGNGSTCVITTQPAACAALVIMAMVKQVRDILKIFQTDLTLELLIAKAM